MSGKKRFDGAGDGWANQHRRSLHECYMQDIDAVLGCSFVDNAEDRLFVEYQPDDHSNAGAGTRKIGFVAFFDRKTGISAKRRFPLSQHVYLELARHVAAGQPEGLAPLFFYVIGGDDPPWQIIEYDLATGRPTGESRELPASETVWRAVWLDLGLLEHRRKVKLWTLAQ